MEDRESQARRTVKKYMGFSVVVGLFASSTQVAHVAGSIVGRLTMPVFAGASTYAIGQVFIQHFESGGTFLDFEPAKVREYFRRQFGRGRDLASEAHGSLAPSIGRLRRRSKTEPMTCVHRRVSLLANPLPPCVQGGICDSSACGRVSDKAPKVNKHTAILGGLAGWPAHLPYRLIFHLSALCHDSPVNLLPATERDKARVVRAHDVCWLA